MIFHFGKQKTDILINKLVRIKNQMEAIASTSLFFFLIGV